MEQIYGVLFCFWIIENTVFEVTERIIETKKVKREEEEEMKKYS